MPTKKPVPKKEAKPASKDVAKKAAPNKATKAATKKVAAAPAPAIAKEAPKKKAPAKQKKGEPGKVVVAPAPIDTVKSNTAITAVSKPTAPIEKETSELKNTSKTTSTNMPDNKSLEQKQPTPRGSGEALVRYNDTDLQQFRDLINRKMDAAKKELNYLQGLITRKDDMGGDESESRYMTMEDGSMSMEREQLSQMASRQITYIDHLEKALIRIENKTYGICRVTGKLIDKARLRAVPHATLSLEAKLGLVKPSGE